MSAARVYDYFLGGSHNFKADRSAAQQLLHAVPSAQSDVWANRAFLRRAMLYMLHQGVRQFLDLGSGLPTVGNVHEIGHNVDPDARVVYVDSDPVAVTYTQRLLADVEHTAVLGADLRDVEDVLGSPEVCDLLDFSQPIGLLAVAVLHFIADHDDPAAILASYADALAPGSHLVVSHAVPLNLDEDQVSAASQIFRGSDTPLTLRDPDQISALLPWSSLLPPSDDMPAVMAPVSRWRPDPIDHAPETRTVFGAVALHPTPRAPTTGQAAPRLPAKQRAASSPSR